MASRPSFTRTWTTGGTGSFRPRFRGDNCHTVGILPLRTYHPLSLHNVSSNASMRRAAPVMSDARGGKTIFHRSHQDVRPDRNTALRRYRGTSRRPSCRIPGDSSLHKYRSSWHSRGLLEALSKRSFSGVRKGQYAGAIVFPLFNCDLEKSLWVLGRIGITPRNAVGLRPWSLPCGSMQKASTICGTRPYKTFDATMSGRKTIVRRRPLSLRAYKWFTATCQSLLSALYFATRWQKCRRLEPRVRIAGHLRPRRRLEEVVSPLIYLGNF